MNMAVTTTNVVLNVAISPSVWLIPLSLIILKHPIEGYNNKLKTSNENMKFGINENLNYYLKQTSPVKKQVRQSLKKLQKLGDQQQQQHSNKTKEKMF